MDFAITFLQIFAIGFLGTLPIILLLHVIIFVLSQIVGRKEGWSKFDSFYFGFVTATTVGYGDMRPRQKLSRCLSLLIAFFGLVLGGLIVSIAISAGAASFQINYDIESIKAHFE